MSDYAEYLVSFAKAHAMQVNIHGSDSSSHNNEVLIEFSPKGLKHEIFLVLRITNIKYTLVKHRSAELTEKYSGRQVSQEWIKNFIISNEPRALEYIYQDSNNNTEPSKKKIFTPEDAERMKNTLTRITCRCSGEVENCRYCDGKGTYVVDGYGNRVSD